MRWDNIKLISIIDVIWKHTYTLLKSCASCEVTLFQRYFLIFISCLIAKFWMYSSVVQDSLVPTMMCCCLFPSDISHQAYNVVHTDCQWSILVLVDQIEFYFGLCYTMKLNVNLLYFVKHISGKGFPYLFNLVILKQGKKPYSIEGKNLLDKG